MTVALGILFLVGFVANSSTVLAALPTQAEIFTISSLGTNYISVDEIFSALPFYKEVNDFDHIKDYHPLHKDADAYQSGVIVLRDKTALFYNTRSSNYLDLTDSSNHSTFYRMAKTSPIRRACPKPPPNVSAFPLPKPEAVFCVATFPWNRGKHFTPQGLVAMLPHFRPLAEQDVPEKAVVCQTGVPPYRCLYPKDWIDAWLKNEPLNGVLVLTNRLVMKWFTWSPHAIVFEFDSDPQCAYFVLDQ